MSVYAILEELNSDSKRKFKLSTLETHKSDELLRMVINLALDPYINFYIRKIPAYSPVGTRSLLWALNELEKLSSREITGNAAIEHLKDILSNLNYEDAQVVERIIKKDLRCGVAASTVNSVIPQFIPEYPCLLARPYDQKSVANIKFPAYSQLKADGLRVNFIVDESGNVDIRGRSGREIDLLGYMSDEFSKLQSLYGTGMVFDGELVVVDDKGAILPRKIGNGIINKAIKGTISEKEASMIRTQIWDAIPYNEFKQEKSKEQYKVRFTKLEEKIKDYRDLYCTGTGAKKEIFWLIPYKVVYTLAEATEHFAEMLAKGHEGTILKNYIGLWENTRSKHLVKMKAEKDCDLEIIGFNPGEGKFAGMVGSIICASSDREVIVSISGFSDEMRATITSRQEELLGTIITVLYNERISSQQNSADSLFLPRFAEFRTDKTVANSSKEIT